MISPAPRDLRELRRRLAPRDLAILASVEQYRLLTTRHVQRLHFNAGHASASAAARACTRALLRLRDLGILRPLDRRIGGVRAGSAGFVWYVGPTGDRLLHHLKHHQLVEPMQLHQDLTDATDAAEAGRPHLRRRRNYQEPSRHFVDHTLAVAELAVTAVEATRATQTASTSTTNGSGYEVLALEAEPACWQPGLSPSGASQWLKPDLRLVTATTTDEYHWFVEVDLATEHIPVFIRQCLAYQDYRATGLYEAAHGLFPAVLWVVPTRARKAALQAALAGTAALDGALFQVWTGDEFCSRVFPPPDPSDSTDPETSRQMGQEG